ncbi:MAG: ferredoxin family protein [Desulfobulbaceae bacterium]|nr:MAG: ferredoxin family protein [Desulfobulbaceae bacterium]
MKDFRYIDGAAILKLDREACIGCGQCVTVCPHRVFALTEKKAEILDPDGCMECGACARNCPVQAIYVNPDDGCGCAALLIARWFNTLIGKETASCC